MCWVIITINILRYFISRTNIVFLLIFYNLILKLGFKAQDDKALQQLLNRKNIDAKLRAVGKSIPAEFLDSKISSQEGELAMAV